MNSTSAISILSTHPLGPLASLAALAQEWHTRDRGLGGTWAGLWHPTREVEILTVVAQHAQRMDDGMLKRLARRGALPGVRDYRLLWAFLSTEPALASEDISCVGSTTQNDEALSDRIGAVDQEGAAADEDEEATIAGIPIWYHGVLEQARLARLGSAKVVLLYEEREYLQLTGVQAGHSVRRHLPRGLHLIFSDQQHRRADRTADLWLEQSEEERQAGSYHFAEAVPPAYAAARKQGSYFRLPDADAVRWYVEDKRENNVV